MALSLDYWVLIRMHRKCFGASETGQTVMEAPSEEDGLVRLIIVRKSSPIEAIPRIVRRETDSLKQEKGRPGGRPRTRASAPPSSPTTGKRR
jgi:hypothetical protein